MIRCMALSVMEELQDVKSTSRQMTASCSSCQEEEQRVQDKSYSKCGCSEEDDHGAHGKKTIIGVATTFQGSLADSAYKNLCRMGKFNMMQIMRSCGRAHRIVSQQLRPSRRDERASSCWSSPSTCTPARSHRHIVITHMHAVTWSCLRQVLVKRMATDRHTGSHPVAEVC